MLTTPVFVKYACALEVDEYALSYFNIKVAKSVSDISYFAAERSQLIKNSKPVGGTFNVGKGGTSYTGNFWMACSNPSLLWRYYTPAGNSFKNQLQEYKKQSPFLDTNNVEVSLFESDAFGVPYSAE